MRCNCDMKGIDCPPKNKEQQSIRKGFQAHGARKIKR